MKRKIIVIVVTSLILVAGALAMFLNSDYYYAKKLVSAIKDENIIEVQRIVEKKPSCINTYPSITTKWWHSAMNWRVCYPLNEAVITGNISLIELLIENGADVNCNDGLTTLSLTYRIKADNWYDISLFLIENGASLDYVTEYSDGKSSILQDIVKSRSESALESEEVIKAFNYALKNCDHSNIDWMRVLQHSVSNGRVEIVRLLLEQGYCAVNDTSVGMTALMFAARDSTTEMVQLLLDYGADKDYISSDGKTAYDYAVEAENQEIIDLLS